MTTGESNQRSRGAAGHYGLLFFLEPMGLAEVMGDITKQARFEERETNPFSGCCQRLLSRLHIAHFRDADKSAAEGNPGDLRQIQTTRARMTAERNGGKDSALDDQKPEASLGLGWLQDRSGDPETSRTAADRPPVRNRATVACSCASQPARGGHQVRQHSSITKRQGRGSRWKGPSP